MAIITQPTPKSECCGAHIEKFITESGLPMIVRSLSRKVKGIHPMMVIRFILSMLFSGRTIHQGLSEAPFAKDVYYRALESFTGWFHKLPEIASNVINGTISPLTGADRAKVFVIDDTAYERGCSKHVELQARLFDHARRRFTKGFRLLTLLWSDGASCVPVDGVLLSSANEKSRMVGPEDVGNDTHRKIIRRESMKKATDVVVDMLALAKRNAIRAKYVLFDSWFTMPGLTTSIHAMGYDVIGMAKKSSKIHFEWQGKMVSDKYIYQHSRKRRGLAHVRLSVDVTVVTEKDGVTTRIPARMVFVSSSANRKNWLVLLSTDTRLSNEQICQLYARRWTTEVFYKVCKSVLRIAKGCQCRHYDSIVSFVSLVLIQYMMLSVMERNDIDDRTIGELFFYMCDQISDISSDAAMSLIVRALFDDITKSFRLSDQDQTKLGQVHNCV
jgi:hypothetical protein